MDASSYSGVSVGLAPVVTTMDHRSISWGLGGMVRSMTSHLLS